jgi:hypothetical protein
VVQQPIVMRHDGPVASAGFLLEALQIKDHDAFPGVADETAFLWRVRYRRDAALSRAEHLGKKFLGERQGVAPRQIACPDQPSPQSRSA